MSTAQENPPVRLTPPGAEFLVAEASPEFAVLRKTLRRFVFPMTAFFLIWYATYVLLSIFATGFMGTKVWGNINAGLLLGLGQFVTTFAITGLYVRYADTKVDPAAAVVREKFEDGSYAAEVHP